jgi:hypothetical protein
MTRERLPNDANSVRITQPDRSEVKVDGYDAADDVAKSFEEAYRAIRARIAMPWLDAEVTGFPSSAVEPSAGGASCMTGRTALAILPRHRAAAVGDSNVVTFPRRPSRRRAGRVTHAGGGPGGPSERIDRIVRRVWALCCENQMSEAAAGELHDALNGLRGSLANSREGAPR